MESQFLRSLFFALILFVLVSALGASSTRPSNGWKNTSLLS